MKKITKKYWTEKQTWKYLLGLCETAIKNDELLRAKVKRVEGYKKRSDFCKRMFKKFH